MQTKAYTLIQAEKTKPYQCLVLSLLVLSQGYGYSAPLGENNSQGKPERLEKLPKAQASEEIQQFDAAIDSLGNTHVVWKNKDDTFFHTMRSESRGWTTPQRLGNGGRLLRLVATVNTTQLFFNSGSEVFRVTGFSPASGDLRKEKLGDTKWFIPSFSTCSDGNDVFITCIARSSEKKATLYQFSPGTDRILREQVLDLPSGSSLRDPEVASCFEARRVHLVLRHGDSSLAYNSFDPETLKPSAWMQVQTTYTPQVSSNVRQAGVGLILDGSLSISPITGNLIVSFTANGPLLLVRDKTGQWSGVSMLAAAGAGRADGYSVSVVPGSNGWHVAWIDARHQEKSSKFGIPWSDDNPYWGNNDIYFSQIAATRSAGEFNASVANARPRRLTAPLGFARSLKLLPNRSGQVELFWLGTDRVAKAPPSRPPFHGIFHATVQP